MTASTAISQIKQEIDTRSELHDKLFCASQLINTAELMTKEMTASPLLDGRKLRETIELLSKSFYPISEVLQANYREMTQVQEMLDNLKTASPFAPPPSQAQTPTHAGNDPF